MPDKLRELQELFVVQAAKYEVFPLDNDILQRILAPKPSYVAGRTEFTYTGALAGIPTATRRTSSPNPSPSPLTSRSLRTVAMG
jgi:hypothetical protein